MHDLLAQLAAAMNEVGALAYCRLVATQGSTPQKAGAAMIVREDGSLLGSLGGGHVEQEVQRLATSVLREPAPLLRTFEFESDAATNEEVHRRGSMTVLLQPLVSDDAKRYAATLCRVALAGEPLMEVIVFEAGSSGLAAPSCYLLGEQNEVLASLHVETANVPEKILQHLRPISTRPRPLAIDGISYLPIFRRSQLLIVGGGRLGQRVASLAAELDFDVWVTDDHEAMISAERFPTATQRIAGQVQTVLPLLDISPSTYCLIITRGHQHDEKALFLLVERQAGYLGMIGSRRKIDSIFESLLAQGVSREALARVHAPVGLDIGSQTVPEIAVSIVAELVAHRNLGAVAVPPRNKLRGSAPT